MPSIIGHNDDDNRLFNTIITQSNNNQRSSLLVMCMFKTYFFPCSVAVKTKFFDSKFQNHQYFRSKAIHAIKILHNSGENISR
ncbi:hypothetical protein DERP_005730 [Dermatophagoides pteronyssinus]|uniref:Uncharacterized protein n=1 Tax=Dermatophagoides pteronyssinus TaxID=6956 RepID=A0ABQ8J9F8_DERPT|nr:hypothetical protein DERP_005730 [Dermatophagoides pteronyssinus]